ncbi:MAG TPA: hypothetical protein VG275_12640 [Solirubrobacteraceae bacterium]|nr:hypothetical protein [Solirubrobacteraceae bacterium]
MSGYAATHVSGLLAWTALVFFGVLVLPRLGYLMWRLWRYGERPKNYSKRYSEEWWLDFQRMGPTAVVAMTFLVTGVEVDYFFGVGNLFPKLVVLISGLLFLIVGALSFAVHYLHRPQWCIAPVLRDPKHSRVRSRPRRG